MRNRGRWALAALVAILAGGCGTGTHRNVSGARGASGSTEYGQAAEGSCMTGEAHGKPLPSSCVFVLTDGRRFRCPQRLARVVQTASSLERSAACRAITPLHLSAAVRRVTALIESAQACLVAHGVRAIGSAVLPPLTTPDSPDGELIAGYLPGGALIAFYRTIAKADRLAPAVLRNARRLHAQVQRSGAVTVFWARPPTAGLRDAVRACLPSA
jgi:hypothetical protein